MPAKSAPKPEPFMGALQEGTKLMPSAKPKSPSVSQPKAPKPKGKSRGMEMG